jgi:hypothetical protein
MPSSSQRTRASTATPNRRCSYNTGSRAHYNFGDTICAGCGKQFKKTSPRRCWCSECSQLSYRARRSGPLKQLACLCCGTRFQQLARNHVYCSRACTLLAAKCRRYGITPAQYWEMLARQEGHCYFCEVAEALHFDHDHETGEVRGLLCLRHNIAIGLFRDSTVALGKAIEYLARAA